MATEERNQWGETHEEHLRELRDLLEPLSKGKTNKKIIVRTEDVSIIDKKVLEIIYLN